MANHTNSKKGTFGTTMGVTSIIAILVILVLIVFAALSITTSRADYTLSQRTAESVESYYAADSDAERVYARIADAVNDGDDWLSVARAQGCTVTSEDTGERVAYAITVNKNKELRVELLVTNEGTVSRELWRVVSTVDWDADTDLNLFK